jgi:hypothetical protein
VKPGHHLPLSTTIIQNTHHKVQQFPYNTIWCLHKYTEICPTDNKQMLMVMEVSCQANTGFQVQILPTKIPPQSIITLPIAAVSSLEFYHGLPLQQKNLKIPN